MKKLNPKHFSGSTDSLKGKRLIFSVLLGVGVGLIALILLLMFFSAICMIMGNPHPFILPLAFFSVYSAAFFAGLFALKRNSKVDALACGGICGAIFMLVVWGVFSIVGYILNVPSDMPSVLKLTIIPVSILGAFAGIGQSSKRPKRKF